MIEEIAAPLVAATLHLPETAPRASLALAHGAGSNRHSPLLRAMAAGFAARGVAVLRCDLPYRQERPSGPPFPAGTARDREGLRAAAALLRGRFGGPVYLGGHSYGGRQATMLAAEDPEAADALLLLSYPLHPPRKPEQLRVAHLPQLRTPSWFAHGTRDPFGSVDELRAALAAIAGRWELHPVERAGHELRTGDADAIAAAFLEFVVL